MLPALNLSLHNTRLNNDDEVEQMQDVDAFLVPFAPPHSPQPKDALASDTSRRSSVRQGQQSTTSDLAARIISGGSWSIAALQVSDKVYKVLVVDIYGVPLVHSVDILKSLIIDSWIVTSNTLAPIAGLVPFKYAVVRGLIMLLVKRVLGIKQMGPLRDVMTMLSFVQLASTVMSATKVNGELAEVLSQISAIPLMLYTALARIVVDSPAVDALKEVMNMNTFDHRVSGLKVSAKKRLGQFGKKLITNWRQFMLDNPVLASFVSKHAIANADQRVFVLTDFSKNVL